MNYKEKIPLIVGIGLPFLLIIFVFATSYLPGLYVKPKYNFIYETGNTYDYEITVISGKISAQPKYQNYYNNTYNPIMPSLYYYDVKNDKSRQISLPEAQALTLDSSSKSPDGLTVGTSNSDYSAFPFFWGSYDRGEYLMGKGFRRKVNDQDYNFKFIGWTTND